MSTSLMSNPLAATFVAIIHLVSPVRNEANT